MTKPQPKVLHRILWSTACHRCENQSIVKLKKYIKIELHHQILKHIFQMVLKPNMKICSKA